MIPVQVAVYGNTQTVRVNVFFRILWTYVFSGRSAAVLGSSNVSTPKIDHDYGLDALYALTSAQR